MCYYYLLLFLDGASIIAISENVIVDQGTEATLSCTVDGNPLTEDTITWKRDDIKNFEKRTTITYDKNGTSYLKVSDVTREDLGNFQCVADNGVGNTSTRDVMLIVKRKQHFMTKYTLRQLYNKLRKKYNK